jgi:hypothetical protein
MKVVKTCRIKSITVSKRAREKISKKSDAGSTAIFEDDQTIGVFLERMKPPN